MVLGLKNQELSTKDQDGPSCNRPRQQRRRPRGASRRRCNPAPRAVDRRARVKLLRDRLRGRRGRTAAALLERRAGRAHRPSGPGAAPGAAGHRARRGPEPPLPGRAADAGSRPDSLRGRDHRPAGAAGAAPAVPAAALRAGAAGGDRRRLARPRQRSSDRGTAARPRTPGAVSRDAPSRGPPSLRPSRGAGRPGLPRTPCRRPARAPA